MATKDKKITVVKADSSSTKIPIPQLEDGFKLSSDKGDNQKSYPMIIWKDMMMDWLQQEDLWSVVDPDNPVDWTKASDAKLKKNSKALLSLRHALPVHLTKAVMRYKFADELWKVLMQVKLFCVTCVCKIALHNIHNIKLCASLVSVPLSLCMELLHLFCVKFRSV